MIRHLLKLVWKRKRANALLILEIFASFVVVFAVVMFGATMLLRWRKPLGFDYHDVWRAHVDFGPRAEMGAADNTPQRAALEAMVREVRTMPQVEAVAVCDTPPYSGGTWITGVSAGGKRAQVWRDSPSDGFEKVMRVSLLRGRWFNEDDESSSQQPLVIDANVARSLFGTTDVVGRTIELGGSGSKRRRDPGDAGTPDTGRVVGVVAPFRKDGELSDDKMQFVFDRYSFVQKRRVARDIMLRLRAGTPAVFEEELIKRLHAVSPEYPLRVEHMDAMRSLRNKVVMAPAILGAIVASFLIIMVALGLSGVLWQTVTRRTRELGLRRALGATRGEVNRQILLEVALLSTLALVVGVVIVAQLPLLGIFGLVTPGAYAIGIAGALATIYALTLVCGVYPSWLAGRVQPAEALHYE